MEELWNELLSHYAVPPEKVSEMFQILEMQYTHQNRHYHNFEHVKTMLMLISQFQSSIKDYNEVRFAVWFHDIIYDPLHSDNESLSAHKAHDFLKQNNVERWRYHKVMAYINRTKDHSARLWSDSVDLQIFLDADLAILGSPQTDYVKYLQNIRKEYHVVPDFVYLPKRKSFLKKILKTKKIYHHPKMQELFEKQAKVNLKFEIELIERNSPIIKE